MTISPAHMLPLDSTADSGSPLPGAQGTGVASGVPSPDPVSARAPNGLDPHVESPLSDEADKAEKGNEKAENKDGKGKKKRKKEKNEVRKADPWQRYKALVDTLKESQDLIDLFDHKARFALMIMGALNAAILLVATRSETLTRVPDSVRPWLYLYSSIYAAIAIYFLLQAIESLRPRRFPVLPRKSTVSEKDESLGIRFFGEAMRYDTPTYVSAWNSVRVSQLNAELSLQLHTLAQINSQKYAAVSKLYVGLKAITVLTAGLLIALGAMAWIDFGLTSIAEPPVVAEEAVKIKGGKPKKGGWAVLGEPERFEVPGVKEPSGIAFSAARGTLFVVGDEGSLVEVSRDGNVLAQMKTGGNLEDLAVHEPSGRLVLLSEKKGELIVVDGAGQKTGQFKLDAPALLGEAPVDKNQGFEGLAFRPEAGRPGGGVFYLVHQRAPAVLVAIAFDPLAPSGSIGAESLISRTTVAGRDDLTAVTFDAALDRLIVIADSKDRLGLLKTSGEEEAEIVLPGIQQEGLSFDPEGNLWIADDRAGLLVFRGARARIAAEMKAPHPDTQTTGKPN
jgi:uncharacterized protein YjiK